MNPGDTQYIVFAQIIAQGSNNINSVQVLKQYSDEIRNYYNDCFTAVTLGISTISTIVSEYSLKQNYPNPFNPVTKIEFSFPKSGNVEVKIYDALGKEISTLVTEKLSPGVYSVNWDGTDYPSGVYFYKLITGDYAETRKMVLIK
jgi:hypothetical protein